MKNKALLRTLSLSVFVLLLMVVFANNVDAQCAMCKASAESNVKGGSAIGRGLNPAILYLMAIPYFLLSFIAWYFFREQIAAKLRQWKIIK